MASELQQYRQSAREQERIGSLMALLPTGATALDIGARDGYLSIRLAERYQAVTALDLENPKIEHPRIVSVQGDVTALDFPDRSFDVVLCAEVLEHVPSHLLSRACSELARVTRSALIVGVPYKQDLRMSRTRCGKCGKLSPPWGHVNAFDERRLVELFRGLKADATSYVGQTRERTNPVSAWLMDLAGNPYGTYEQDEPCVHCGAHLVAPAARSIAQRVCSKLSLTLESLQQALMPPHPRWIHMRMVQSAQ